jgi:DNA-binding CsgD family transcriptional regulator
VEANEPASAARYAFWLGFHLINRGEAARGSGWFGRATRQLQHAGGDCAERGYLLLPVGHQKLFAGDLDGAIRAASEAVAVGERFGDPDLLALALHMHGRALLRQSRVEEGLALLDEAMVSVATGELSPQVTGLIYCSVISACREVWALGRAHQWTAALTNWCDGQPDMVPYTGECRVYRAEILQLHGAWGEAMDEARRASECFERGREPGGVGLALYQQGELHRLRGALAAAEEAYRAASRAGREPQPGLALLRLAQGEPDAAASAIRRALAETTNRLRRARLLPACIEIMLETGEIDEARRTWTELAEIARDCAGGVLGTIVTHAEGAIELAGGNPGSALAPLRRAWQEWREADAPYEAARARVLLGLACRELGDEDGASLELDAARAEFERLGAAPELARLDALARRRTSRGAHGLTPREREVLALVATGRTNRAIAEKLFISEKTVARHVANIFRKLGVSSRAAATAFAYERHLLDPPT